MKNFTKDNLEVNILESRLAMGKTAAKMAGARLRNILKRKEEAYVIFAAAPSQNEFLAALCQEDVDWARLHAFHMDEYMGLPAHAPQSFGHFLKERIFSKKNFKSINYINGNATNPNEECNRYEQLLKANPPDIVCMGIGENGHIAFNDPWVADFADKKWVKVVALDAVCRQQQVNDGCFKNIDEVPTHALTLTIPALMSADFVYCMVPGSLKARAVYNTIFKEIQPLYPSTILRQHTHAALFLDADSNALLNTEPANGE